MYIDLNRVLLTEVDILVTGNTHDFFMNGTHSLGANRLRTCLLLSKNIIGACKGSFKMNRIEALVAYRNISSTLTLS